MQVEEAPLGLVLDAFGNHFEAEAAGHADDGLDDHRIAGIGLDVADEGAVDLQLIERQPAQIGKRRIAGAEIVHRKTDTEQFQRLHLFDGVGDVVQHHTLGQLQFQTQWIGSARVDDRAHLIDEIRLAKLAGADIHGQH